MVAGALVFAGVAVVRLSPSLEPAASNG
jgi:hypothetical protein